MLLAKIETEIGISGQQVQQRHNMGPVEQKTHVRQAPDWIDEKTVKSLPEEKQEYWRRRILGKNGQEKFNPKGKVIKTPEGMTVGFDNDGNMVAKNRALRRRKLPTENKYTKSTKKNRKHK